MVRKLAAVLLLAAFIPASALAITLGQIDTFQDGGTQGWGEGGPSPNPPTNVSTGGPDGTGDRYLRNISSGNGGPGGRMVMFNVSTWRGNYITAGVTRVRFDARNFGNSTLNLRVAIEGTSSQWVSTTAQPITNDGAWHTLTFDLGEMSSILGAATLEQVLASVGVVRILSATTTTWLGQLINGSLGVDNIEALGDEVPVEGTTWGGIKALYP